eukprot:298811-Karenia_brevis.AAC.1
MEHAMHCFARVIRIILGPDAVAEHKLGCGKQLEVLGVQVTVGENGFRCAPAPLKVKKWLAEIGTALHEHKLSAGAASKLGGRLSWGSSVMFHRVGRA